ncbi:hypothetical protein MRX96_009285 [Rhipicephalus microplus]
MFSANATTLGTVLQEYLRVPKFPSSCWPSRELAHVNMPDTFEYGYRLDPGPDESNFTSGFNVSLHEPTLITFPSVSSLGLWWYTVHKFASHQPRKGRARDNESMTTPEQSCMFLFPEVGLWYLGLLPLCYLDDSGNSSEPNWVPCEMESAHVELTINSTACLNNKCGLFGRCFPVHQWRDDLQQLLLHVWLPWVGGVQTTVKPVTIRTC